MTLCCIDLKAFYYIYVCHMLYLKKKPRMYFYFDPSLKFKSPSFVRLLRYYFSVLINLSVFFGSIGLMSCLVSCAQCRYSLRKNVIFLFRWVFVINVSLDMRFLDLIATHHQTAVLFVVVFYSFFPKRNFDQWNHITNR